MISLLLTISLTVPLGPGTERLARDLAQPDTLGEALEGSEALLWGIAVEAEGIRYTIKDAAQEISTTVWIDATTHDIQVETSPDSALQSAASSFAERLRVKLPPRAPPGVQDKAAPELSPTAATRSTPGWMTYVLLMLLGLGLLLTARPAVASIRSAGGWAFIAITSLTCITAALLFSLPDVIAHHHGHGYDTARAVAGFDSMVFGNHQPFGSLATSWAALIGMGDAFDASRVAAIVCIPLMFALAFTLTGERLAAILAAGLMMTQPAFLYMARAETTTAQGLVLLLLAALWSVWAVKARSLPIFVAAIGALCTLGHYRLLGPVALAPLALFFLLPWSPQGRLPWRWLIPAGISVTFVVAPHALDVLEVLSQSEPSRTPPSSAHLPTTLLESSPWTAPAVGILFVVAMFISLRRRAWLMLVISAMTLALLFAPIGAAHVWSAWPRYQLWALAPVIIAIATLLSDLHLWRKRVGIASALLALSAIGFGSALPAQSLALEHPEDIQLTAWRAALEALPPQATLVLPARASGQARPSLPDHELALRRPDVSVKSLEVFDPAGSGEAFWFEPLYCHALYPGTERIGGNPCDGVRRDFTLRPVAVWGADTTIPDHFVDDGLPADWHLIPYPTETIRIGLYRLEAR